MDAGSPLTYITIGMEITPTLNRGRPREFDPDQALSAALQVFWRRGYDGASMVELTEAMGITKPSLYACFGNKESLFRQALDLYEREKLSYVNAALEAPTARGVAERLLRGSLDVQMGSSEALGCMNVISTVACGGENDSIRQHVVERRAAADAAMLARFTRARDEGDLPATVEPQAMVCYLSTVIQGMAVQAGGGASRETLDRLIDTTLAIWPGK